MLPLVELSFRIAILVLTMTARQSRPETTTLHSADGRLLMDIGADFVVATA